jgi:hypothetical protein
LAEVDAVPKNPIKQAPSSVARGDTVGGGGGIFQAAPAPSGSHFSSLKSSRHAGFGDDLIDGMF